MSKPGQISFDSAARHVIAALVGGAAIGVPCAALAQQTAEPRSVAAAAPVSPRARGTVASTIAAPPREPAFNEDTCVGSMAVPTLVQLPPGKSMLLPLPAPIKMRTVGDKEIVQTRLLGAQTLYLLGVDVGSTNMILQDAQGHCEVIDVTVGMDVAALRAKLAELLPTEPGLLVTPAADTLVLSGSVSDAVKVEQAVQLANAYVRAPVGRNRSVAISGAAGAQGAAAIGNQSIRVINLLTVAASQQVMLEVKVAEISRTLADKLGVSVNASTTGGNFTYRLGSSFSAGGAGVLDVIRSATGSISIDADKQDGLVKLLAEPNLIAISGQEGSFLAGGKVFIPVAQGGGAGVATFTLQEESFGVGLRFTPTVLEGGRINLKVMPEVSELSDQGFAIRAAGSGATTILPLITTRRASTTVQLFDGQSFVIGGLVKNNATTGVKALPVLGEIPILGALFRSTSFQTDKSELVFVLTPHLVKPVGGEVRLPTDSYVEPSRRELFLGGRMEGTPSAPAAEAPDESKSGAK
jgi:pilus assembly protein CpaC